MTDTEDVVEDEEVVDEDEELEDLEPTADDLVEATTPPDPGDPEPFCSQRYGIIASPAAGIKDIFTGRGLLFLERRDNRFDHLFLDRQLDIIPGYAAIDAPEEPIQM